jgi:hypothetical protein
MTTTIYTETNQVTKQGVSLTYTIDKVQKVGTQRIFFIPKINGKTVTRTMYARKYDAENLITAAINNLGIKKLNELAQ